MNLTRSSHQLPTSNFCPSSSPVWRLLKLSSKQVSSSSFPSLVESCKSTSHGLDKNRCSDTAAYKNGTKSCYQLHQPSHGTGYTLQREQMTWEEKKLETTLLNSLISNFQDPHSQQYQASDVHIYSFEVLNVHQFWNFQQTKEPIHTEKAFFFLVISPPPGSLGTRHPLQNVYKWRIVEVSGLGFLQMKMHKRNRCHECFTLIPMMNFQ